MYCIRQIQGSGIFRTLYSGIFKHIHINKEHSSILRHYQGIFRLSQAYSAFCVTLAYSQSSHILSPDIFKTRGSKRSETLTSIFRTLPQSKQFIQALFSHIQAYSETCASLHMQKPSIFRILEYSEPFHNCMSMHIQDHVIFIKIGKPCITLEIQNSDILTIPEYSEPKHI